MKEKYMETELEIIKFKTGDMISTSGVDLSDESSDDKTPFLPN